MKKLDILSYLAYGLTGFMYLFIVFNTLTNPQNPDLEIKAGILLPVMAAVTVAVLVGAYICRRFRYKKLLLAAFTAVLVFLQ